MEDMPVDEQLTFSFEPKPTAKDFPELRWAGKRPCRSVQYCPAQLREVYGEEQYGWINKLFWGDNIQVMGHLLKDYRGKIDLVYIDPPFGSSADYKIRIRVKQRRASGNHPVFEEKQYGDIWSDGEYLQFLYERLLILRELLSGHGSIFVHCDHHKNYHIRALLDEVFGVENFINEIVWRRKGGSALGSMNSLSNATDTIYWYSKTAAYTLNPIYVGASRAYMDAQFRYADPDGRRYMITVMRSPNPRPHLMYDYKGYKMPPNGWSVTLDKMKQLDEQGYLHFPDSKDKQIYRKIYLDEYRGQAINNLWTEISTLKGSNHEITRYPTQKPEELLSRIIEMASNPGDLVFDCFMGSGTTQAAAMKLGRRFLGADVNLSAVQISAKRLLSAAAGLHAGIRYAGFAVYSVNPHDLFHNPAQARDLLMKALKIRPLPQENIWDGELDGRKVKIMPVDKIASRADLADLFARLPYKDYQARKEAQPGRPTESVTLICMGHELGLKAALEQELADYGVDIQIVDVSWDETGIHFKGNSKAEILCKDGRLIVRAFHPADLMRKLSRRRESIEDWRQLVDSIMIDWNYDGAVLRPALTDIPDRGELVRGVYDIPQDAGTIRVKITDLRFDSLEIEIYRAGAGLENNDKKGSEDRRGRTRRTTQAG